MLSEILKELKSKPTTLFDNYDTGIDTRIVGSAVKDRLAELTQLLSTINGYKTHAMLMKKQAETKLEELTTLAWRAIGKNKEMNTTEKRIEVKTQEVELYGEVTTINELTAKINLYEYVFERGKDKAKEVEKSLDAARSMLSWDKQEHNKSEYGGS